MVGGSVIRSCDQFMGSAIQSVKLSGKTFEQELVQKTEVVELAVVMHTCNPGTWEDPDLRGGLQSDTLSQKQQKTEVVCGSSLILQVFLFCLDLFVSECFDCMHVSVLWVPGALQVRRRCPSFGTGITNRDQPTGGSWELNPGPW